MTAFAEWEDGLLTDTQALRALCSDLAEIESDIEPLAEQKTTLRDQISRIVEHAGGKAEIAGFGQLAITPASVAASYDTKALDELIIRLTQDGNAAAELIARCRKESARAGSLRIVREKGVRR